MSSLHSLKRLIYLDGCNRVFDFSPFVDITEYIESIKTRADLEQLRFDVRASGCNLIEFRAGIPGVWSLEDYRNKGESDRHVFILRSVYEKIGLTPEERQQMTSLTMLGD